MTCGIRRPAGQIRIGIPTIIQAGRRANQIYLHVQVGNVGLFDRHAQGVCRAVHAEALAAHQSRTPQRQQALGRVEWRLDEDFRHIAGLILFAVGDQGDFFLFHVSGWRPAASAHPARHLGAIGSAAVIEYRRGDAIGAAFRRLEGTASRLRAGFYRARLHDSLHFLPGAALVLPLQARRGQLDGAAGYGSAVEIGDDRVDAQRVATLHEHALAAEPNVEFRGMDQQQRAGRPGLPVHVHHGRFGGDAGWFGGTDPIEVKPQCMFAGCIRLGIEGLGCGVLFGPVAALVAPEDPPGGPLAEGEIVPARWAVVAGGGGHAPGHVRAGQCAAGVVAGGDIDRRKVAHEVWTLTGRRLHLELRPAEFLNLDSVSMPAPRALQGKLDTGVAKIHGVWQRDDQIEAAQPSDRGRSVE